MISELKTLIIAMSPVIELRGSIPIAIEVYGLSLWSSYLWSVIGNIIPIIPVIFFLNYFSEYLSHKFYFFNRFFVWLFERTRQHHKHKFERWESLALLILVAIPLPFTGVWTGSVAAFVFGIPLKKAFLLIFLGSCLAGVAVSLLTIGVINFI
jgi:uncharacterized membrane protein